MYKIKGADQKEYGPVTADQIRQWVRENRLNRFSLAESAETPGWKPLESFAEFAGLFAAPPPSLGAGQPAYPSASFSSPTQAVLADPVSAAAQLRAPAIILIVMAAIGLVMGLGSALTKRPMMDGIIHVLEQSHVQLPPDALAQLEKARDEGFTIKDGFGTAIGVVSNVLMLIGALKMMKLESWGLALTSAILVMLPCGSCCCCIGLGVGIWTAVILSKPEVKGAFR